MCWLPRHTQETQGRFAFHSGPLATARSAHRTRKPSLTCSPTISALQVDPVVSFLSFIRLFFKHFSGYLLYLQVSFILQKSRWLCPGPHPQRRESLEAGNVPRWNWTYFPGREHRAWANHGEGRKGRAQESCVIITNDAS